MADYRDSCGDGQAMVTGVMAGVTMWQRSGLWRGCSQGNGSGKVRALVTAAVMVMSVIHRQEYIGG